MSHVTVENLTYEVEDDFDFEFLGSREKFGQVIIGSEHWIDIVKVLNVIPSIWMIRLIRKLH